MSDNDSGTERRSGVEVYPSSRFEIVRLGVTVEIPPEVCRQARARYERALANGYDAPYDDERANLEEFIADHIEIAEFVFPDESRRE